MNIALLSKRPRKLIFPFSVGDNQNAFRLFERAQRSTGMATFPFVRAGVKNVQDVTGQLVQVDANKPAVEFRDGVNKGLWIEPSATNLLQRSEEFDNAYWGKSRLNAFGSGSIANDAVAPDGTTTADYVQQETGQTSHGGVLRFFSLTAGTVYTLSVFAKKDEQGFLNLGGAFGAAGNISFCGFNLTTGAIGTPESGITPSILAYPNGWYRCSITFTAIETGSRNLFLYQASVIDTKTATPDEGLFIWGAQLETGSVATSYIKTTNATATRPADVATITNAQDLIGQTEGTIPIQVHCRDYGAGRSIAVIGTLADGIHIFQTGLTVSAVFNSGGVARATLTGTLTAGFNGIAVRYNGTAVSLTVNGIEVGTGTATGWTPATMSQFSIGCDSDGANQYGDFIGSLNILNRI